MQYTGSLAPVDFSGAVFTHAYFQKIAKISSLCDFHYISEGIPSLLRFGLLMTYVLRIWVMWIFARPKKTHKLRTGCQNAQAKDRVSLLYFLEKKGNIRGLFFFIR